MLLNALVFRRVTVETPTVPFGFASWRMPITVSRMLTRKNSFQSEDKVENKQRPAPGKIGCVLYIFGGKAKLTI